MKFVGHKDETRFQTEIRELVTGISNMVFVALLSIPIGFGTFVSFSYLEPEGVMYIAAISFAVVGVVSAWINSMLESVYGKREFLDSLDEDYEWKIEEKEEDKELDINDILRREIGTAKKLLDEITKEASKK